ncbi:MAG: hypothetical protein ABEH60_03860 [Halonotius sp.]
MASLLLVGTVSIGASAFTAATVERSASVDVVADNEGLLALTDGNSGDLVFQDGSTEQLGIDLARGTAAGGNPNATFELGNPAAPTTSNAFTIENQDAGSDMPADDEGDSSAWETLSDAIDPEGELREQQAVLNPAVEDDAAGKPADD